MEIWEKALHLLVSRSDAVPDLGVTPGAHLSRAQAAALPVATASTQPERLPPQPTTSDLGARIGAAWKEILKLDSIDGKTNFFEAGGHSLLALRVISRVNDLVGTRIPVATLFQSPTLDGFIAAISETSHRSDY